MLCPMQIDWGTAEVLDGVLTVELDDEPPKEWPDRLGHVLERLGHGADAVEVDGRALGVSGVSPGREADVRHLLESGVLQADADLAPDEDEVSGEDEKSEEDREMTDAFREFAPRDSGEQGE